MKKYLLCLTATALSCVSIAQADPGYTWVTSISMGPVWNTNNGESQTFFLDPGTEKTYHTDGSSNVMVDGEIFVGVQWPSHHVIQGQLGLAYAAAGNADLSGEIWDDADPEFNNYTYQYNVNHMHVSVKGKVLADWGSWVIPWLSASMGVGFNKAFDFDNTPTIFEAVPNPNFTSQTTTSFTYTLGVGLQAVVAKHWQLGMGYEFADWGKSELGKAAGQTTNHGIELDHLYTNGLMFNITYLF